MRRVLTAKDYKQQQFLYIKERMEQEERNRIQRETWQVMQEQQAEEDYRLLVCELLYLIQCGLRPDGWSTFELPRNLKTEVANRLYDEFPVHLHKRHGTIKVTPEIKARFVPSIPTPTPWFLEDEK